MPNLAEEEYMCALEQANMELRAKIAELEDMLRRTLPHVPSGNRKYIEAALEGDK